MPTKKFTTKAATKKAFLEKLKRESGAAIPRHEIKKAFKRHKTTKLK